MADNSKYTRLLEPHYIGGVKIRNRIIKTAAETFLYNENDGYVNDTCKYFYETMARGGAGAVYVEGPAIDPPLSKIAKWGLRLDDDKYIKGFSELTAGIHKHGCPAFLQLLHAGPWHQSFVTGHQAVSSSVPPQAEFAVWGSNMPRELAIDEIEKIIEKFTNAAVRAEKAGFDGVDLNAGGAHLLSAFLSGYLNSRRDDYGGPLENRARIVVTIIQRIKKRLGNDYPVGVVMNGVEVGYPESTEQAIEEGQALAQILEKAGADSIQVRRYQYGYIGSLWPEQFLYPEPFEPLPKELDWSRKGAGAFVPLAEEIKKKVSIPVITVGRLDPELGERVLHEGKADFIGMCRRLFADPDLPNKIAAGKPEDIAPCTACLYCLDRVRMREPIHCRINASLGKSRDFEIKPAEKKKKVMVVGGGPAGMEAARVAALRGHEGVLFAKEPKLGGMLPTAAMIKGTEIEDLVSFIRYFKRQLTKLCIDVRLGKEITAHDVEALSPDTVILAVGGLPISPDIPGTGRPNVLKSEDLHKKLKIFQRFMGPDLLGWLTRFWMPIGKQVLVIGGAMHGCELAEFLTLRGRKVTIVDTADQLGNGIVSEQKNRLLKWMAVKKVSMITGVKTYKKITRKGLAIINKNGNEQFLEADNILTALPVAPNNELMEILKNKAPEIVVIGDCREPGLIAHAVADGAKAGRKI